MLHLNEEIDRLWRRLDQNRNIEKLKRDADFWYEHTAKLRAETEQLLVKSHAQSSQYVTVVVAVGYVGYFTTWNFCRGLLSAPETARVALFGLLSLAVYCAWEIFALQMRMRFLGQMGDMLHAASPDDFEEKRQRHLSRDAWWIARTRPIWAGVLFISVGSVIIGASLMVYRLYMSL
jgi:hypothetical protein